MTLAPITAMGTTADGLEANARTQLRERLLVFGYPKDEAMKYVAAAVREPSPSDPHDFLLVGKLRHEIPFRVEVRVP